ncbi:MAG: DUF4831 family protein [Muribaculaceae bacterium]|nr:DUF4831 family protein [Muribaculaceae bacterium]
MKKVKTTLIAALAATTMATAQQAQRITATKANEYGISYTLPTTAVDITIEAEFTREEPGEFYKYALKYLNINDPITESTVSARVKSVTINTHGVPDPDKRYLVTLKSSQAPYILIGEGNIPLAINTEDIAGSKHTALPIARDAEPTPLQSQAARQVITQEMLQSHSSAKRAELAAEQIYALRQSRTDLITGQADQMPPDGAAMKLVMDNIDAQEQALMAMFAGTRSTHTEVRTFTIVPEDNINKQIIARVSATSGIVEANDLSGFPVYLSLKILNRGEMPVNDKGETLPFPKGGIAYVIPGEAQVTVTAMGKEFASKEVDLAQAGIVYGMAPSNFTDKKAPVYLQFDASTGAIAEVGPAIR